MHLTHLFTSVNHTCYHAYLYPPLSPSLHHCVSSLSLSFSVPALGLPSLYSHQLLIWSCSELFLPFNCLQSAQLLLSVFSASIHWLHSCFLPIIHHSNCQLFAISVFSLSPVGIFIWLKLCFVVSQIYKQQTYLQPSHQAHSTYFLVQFKLTTLLL